MKICDLCGHANYSFIYRDKKPMCNNCGKPMSEIPQCKPTRKNSFGQPLQGETSKLKCDYDGDWGR